MCLLSQKQYLYSSRKLDIAEMNCIQLMVGYLYVHSDLPFLQAKDKKNREYTVLGNAFCMDEYPKQILDDIHSFEDDSLVKMTRNWTGRWVMIRDHELITDATGLMSAFYWTNKTDWMVSSSIALLARELKLSNKRRVRNQGLDWQLLPDTLLPNVNRLFCTQVLRVSDSLEVHFIERFSDKHMLTSEQRVKEVTKRLQIVFKNIEKFSDRQIVIALTAGKDSRLVLAAALSAKVKFSTYTMEYSGMQLADKKLPEIIAQKYGFPWSLIRKKSQKSHLFNDYLLFNGGNSQGVDIIFYSSEQTQQLPSNAIVVRSGIFEAGQLYGRRVMGNTIETLKNGFYKYYKTSLKVKGQREAFEKWISYVEAHPIPFIDLRDRFYIEQRVNGWVSSIEQALTINDFTTLQIANCQEIISVLLSATEKERECNRLAMSMITAICPDLCDFPVNQRTIMDKLNIIKRSIIKKLFK